MSRRIKSRAARVAKPLIYVPNSGSDTVDVIDPTTFKIVEHFVVGGLPQHVVPAYDLKTLYITTAWLHLTPEARETQPLAGGLFTARVDTPGLAQNLVRLD